MVQDKACTLFIGLEAKFLSDKTYLYVGFVTVGIKSARKEQHTTSRRTLTLYKWLQVRKVARGPQTCPSDKPPC